MARKYLYMSFVTETHQDDEIELFTTPELAVAHTQARVQVLAPNFVKERNGIKEMEDYLVKSHCESARKFPRTWNGNIYEASFGDGNYAFVERKTIHETKV